MKPNEKSQWQKRPEYTFEAMLDAPCKYHSGAGKPASHTTRDCGWTKRLAQG